MRQPLFPIFTASTWLSLCECLMSVSLWIDSLFQQEISLNVNYVFGKMSQKYLSNHWFASIQWKSSLHTGSIQVCLFFDSRFSMLTLFPAYFAHMRSVSLAIPFDGIIASLHNAPWATPQIMAFYMHAQNGLLCIFWRWKRDYVLCIIGTVVKGYTRMT